MIIHFSRNVNKAYRREKIICREMQQELYLLEFFLGHITHISPENPSTSPI